MIFLNFGWTWKRFGYYSWSVKRPNIFTWPSLTSGYRWNGARQALLSAWHFHNLFNMLRQCKKNFIANLGKVICFRNHLTSVPSVQSKAEAMSPKTFEQRLILHHCQEYKLCCNGIFSTTLPCGDGIDDSASCKSPDWRRSLEKPSEPMLCESHRTTAWLSKPRRCKQNSLETSKCSRSNLL